MKLLIIIPAYNEAQVLGQTLKGVRKIAKKIKNTHILVVDDGSTDNTSKVAINQRVKVVRHIINRGLGGAIGTGLTYAKKHGFDTALTFDADGQHNPHDIPKTLKPILAKKADIVIGTRTKHGKGQVPLDRQIIHAASNLLTQIFFGQVTSDSQSGFRVFNQKAIKGIVIKTDRMEVSSELFSEIKRLNLRVAEVPIKVIYTPYSRAKGQSNTNAIFIIFKLILRLFR